VRANIRCDATNAAAPASPVNARKRRREMSELRLPVMGFLLFAWISQTPEVSADRLLIQRSAKASLTSSGFSAFLDICNKCKQVDIHPILMGCGQPMWCARIVDLLSAGNQLGGLVAGVLDWNNLIRFTMKDQRG